MSEEATIRYLGANVREVVANNYRVNGEGFGYKLASRIVGEMAATVTEVHSRRDAYAMLIRASDRLVNYRLLEDDAAPAVLDMEDWTPGMKAAAARATADPASATPAIFWAADRDVLVIQNMDVAKARNLLEVGLLELGVRERSGWKPWQRKAYSLTRATQQAWPWFAFWFGLFVGQVSR